MELATKNLGKYRLLEEIERGGAGILYRGEDTHASRPAALLLLVPPLLWPRENALKLVEELRGPSRLRHPNIAIVLEAGQEGAWCYLAMEQPGGQPLSRRLREQGPLPLAQAIEVIRQAAAALDYAHSHDQLHGDLTSSQIIFDEQGRVLLYGLGVVPALARNRPAGAGVIAGTPEYTAPEVVQGQERSARSDVYALGILAYELLAGHPPFQAPDAWAILRRQINDAPAPEPLLREAPESVVQTIAWALAKDPAQRPASAGALAGALRDAAGGQRPAEAPAQLPVTPALPESPAPSPAAEPSPAPAWEQEEQAAREHEAAGQWAEAAAAWRRLYAGAWREAYEGLRAARTTPAARLAPNSSADLSPQEEKKHLAALRIAPLLALREDQTDAEWNNLGIITLDISPAGDLLAAGSEEGLIWLWAPATEELVRTWQAHEGDIWGISFSPDGQLLASAGDDGTVALWEVATGEQVLRIQVGESLDAVAFSPDGTAVATGADDGIVRIFDASNGQQVRELADHSGPVYNIAYSPDGSLLASGSEDEVVLLWDPRTGRQISRFDAEAGPINAVAISPDGLLLAAGGEDGRVFLWTIESGRQLHVLEGHEQPINGLAFSRDGRLLASAAADKTARVWSVSFGWEVAVLDRHDDWVTSVVFAPDDSMLATGSYDAAVWLWALTEEEQERPRGPWLMAAD